MITFKQMDQMEAQAKYVILRAIVLLLLVTSDAVNGLKCLNCRGAPADPCTYEEICPPGSAGSPSIFHCESSASKTFGYSPSNDPIVKGPEILTRGCSVSNEFVDTRMNACATKAELANGDVNDPGQPPKSPTYTPYHYSVYCVCDKDLCNKDASGTALAPPTTTCIQSYLAQTFVFFLGIIFKGFLT